jgi:hypothetical protein
MRWLAILTITGFAICDTFGNQGHATSMALDVAAVAGNSISSSLNFANLAHSFGL